jgi:ubiquinone/menaquinone biosynthesis C-methylase UbiE
VREGWQAVDQSGDAQAFIDYLGAVSAQEAVRRYKRATIEAMALRAGDAALDVGCGAGDEVLAIAAIVGEQGRAVGIDASAAMVAEGRRRAEAGSVRAEFEVGDAQSLPFKDGTFDAARIERTLEHLADPGAALRELRRVCRPGARVVSLEPDWDGMMVDADDAELTRLLARVHASHVQHGRIGRELRRRFVDAGLQSVAVEPLLLQMTDLGTADPVLGLREATDEAVRDGEIDRASGDRWLAGLRAADARGAFYAALPGFIAVGRVP